jgi:glycosyltransferase involved in cell wall biosynthesis
MTDVVLHIVTSLDFGGIESHMEVIARNLSYAKMRHVFVAIGPGGMTTAKMRIQGVDFLCLGQNIGIPSLSAFGGLIKLFWRERPLVVHTHGAEANFHGLIAAWLARVPVRIGEEVGIPSHSNEAKKVFRLVYSAAHRVIGVSQSVTDWLVSSREVPSCKAVRVYNPVDLPKLDEAVVAPENVFRIGFVGRLEAVKNSLALLNAFIELHDSGTPCELWIVGDGSERVELERRVGEMKLAHKVRFFGYQVDPASFVRQCHVYVQPSLSEGFGLALVEAMGCGVPVIATAVGGAPEIISHGKNGWLLPQASSEAIFITLKGAWALGPKELREIGLRARESVESRFEPINYIERIEALYRQIYCERRVLQT